ncbi:hypothetical protein [Halobacillus halophilus]|uniref:hypothetical protein n=1 Tax=Halobacillus halophilus TaxID=1570 RepID=UPI001CD79D4F|nr:hypothetical protein [Halobacillus halophilus]MCA1010570.1 hypothetical protein [Halobacillus halophilus]
MNDTYEVEKVIIRQHYLILVDTLVFVWTFLEVRGALVNQEKAGLRGNIKMQSS